VLGVGVGVWPRTLCTIKLGVESGDVTESSISEPVSRPGSGGCGGMGELVLFDVVELRRNWISETDTGTLSAGDTGDSGWIPNAVG